MSYRDLLSYKQATIIYDFTFDFCNRYIDKKSRTHDQMVQAARSGKQNIVEGSTEKTSQKSELKLLGVARASFQELLEDYEDFLRQRRLKQWGKDEPAAIEVRNLYKTDWSNRTNLTNWSNRTDGTNWTNGAYMTYLEKPEIAANAAICLIHQVNFLLDRQIKSLEEKFVQSGGWTENLAKKRKEERRKQILERFERNR